MTVKGKQMEASQVPHLSSSELAASRCRWSRYLEGNIYIKVEIPGRLRYEMVQIPGKKLKQGSAEQNFEEFYVTLSQFDSITLYGRFPSVLNFCKLEFCEEEFNKLLFLTGTGQDSKKKNQERLQATFKNISF